MRGARPVQLLLPVVLLLAGVTPAASGEEEALAVAVAPFEVSAPSGSAVPDVAQLLVERLGSRGVARIVGPSQLGAPADAEAASTEVRAWADGAEVDAVVLGRTTRVGDQLSVDVRLRQGDTGAVVETFVHEVATPDDLSGAVDTLASQVIDGTAALRAAPGAPAPVGAGEPAPAATALAPTPGPGGSRGENPFGFEGWDSGAPLSIESEELDIEEENGRRRLVFAGNVRATQGGLKLRAAHLVATYPEGGRDPDRLEARGNVRLAQKNQKARCNGAVLDRVRDVFTCRGDAAFRDGDSCMAGDEIVVDLRTDKVKVKGGASVLIKPDGEACGL